MRTKKELYALSDDELNRLAIELYNYNSGRGILQFFNIRSVMMLQLSCGLGLRPKECYNALVCHVDLEKHDLFIPGENNKQRFSDHCYLGTALTIRLEAYMELRNKYFPDSPWLFPALSKRGRLSRIIWERIIRTAARRAGIYQVAYIDGKEQKRGIITPYVFRSTFATRGYEFFKDVRIVSILLRHRDPQMRTIWRYLRISHEKIRREAMQEMQEKSGFLDVFFDKK